MGPLLVINGVISPISRVITPVTHLFSAIYRAENNSTYNWIRGPPCRINEFSRVFQPHWVSTHKVGLVKTSVYYSRMYRLVGSWEWLVNSKGTPTYPESRIPPGFPFHPQMIQEFRNIYCWLGVVWVCSRGMLESS